MNYYLRHPYARFVAAAIGIDLLVFGLAALGTWALSRPPWAPAAFALGSAVGALTCVAASAISQAYTPETLSSWHQTVRALLKSMGIDFVLALILLAALHPAPALTETLASVGLLYFTLLLAARFGFRSVASLRKPGRRVLILGGSDLAISIAEFITSRPQAGIELVGFLCDDFLPDGIAGYPVLGPVHQLEKVLDVTGVDTIVVALKQRDDVFPADELIQAKLRGLQVESGVAFYERLTGRLHLRDLRQSYLIFSDGFRTSPLAERVRRAFEVAMAALALVVVAPVLAVCAVAIRLDSKGPVFYRQARVGKDGRIIRVLKLRTMRVDAEAGSGAKFACQDDPRVTRVGRILRMTRLDEVPQYWNVLKGDMGVVGPRPERPEFMDILASRYPLVRLRLAHKPGVTGWAQVRYGYVGDIEEWETKLGLDLYYMKHRSLLFDLVIILQTVKTVLLFRGI